MPLDKVGAIGGDTLGCDVVARVGDWSAAG
jgi:hypothetical protein